MKIGYARVSTNGQSLEIQLEKLQAHGCDKIFHEKQSGASKQGRVVLNETLNFIREWDELVITRLDRLARSVLDLTAIAGELGEKGVGFVVLDQQIDTTTPTGKLLFHMLAAIWEFERELINERVRDGLAKAKKKGVKLGRKPKLTASEIRQLRAEFLSAKTSNRTALARKFGIGKTTMYRLAANGA